MSEQLRVLADDVGVCRQSYFLLLVDDSAASAPAPPREGVPSRRRSAGDASSTSQTLNLIRLCVPLQSWGGKGAEADALRVIASLIDATNLLDGQINLVVIFTPADASASALASRVMQLAPDFFPHLPLSACAVFCPLDTAGVGCLHAALGLQYAFTYCTNVYIRDMEDYLRLFAQLVGSPPAITSLYASVAADLVLLPLLQTSALWSLTGSSKLMDLRSSLWHRLFAHGPTSVRRDCKHDPARAVPAMLHALSLATIPGDTRTATIHTASLCQVQLDSRTAVRRVSSQLQSLSFAENRVSRICLTPVADVLAKAIEKQLASGTPKCIWPTKINHFQPRDPTRKSSDIETAEVILFFDSPFCRAKVKAVLHQSEVLLCSGGGAFLQR